MKDVQDIKSKSFSIQLNEGYLQRESTQYPLAWSHFLGIKKKHTKPSKN